MKAQLSGLAMISWASMAIWASTATPSYGLVIDSFDSGPLVEGPGRVNLSLTQDSLPADEVLGGARELFVLHDGGVEIGQAAGTLDFSYDGGLFEVVSMRYGSLVSGQPDNYLNADLTAGGHDRLRLSMASSTANDSHDCPIVLRVSLLSGRETGDAFGGSVAVEMIPSAEDYYFDLPYSEFVLASQGELDMTDIDAIAIAVFVQTNEADQFSIAEIATAAAPVKGDYNADGLVNAQDYEAWQNQFGLSGPLNADGNGDGVVDIADYTVWRDNLWTSPPSAISIPEPSTVVLIATGSVLCGRRRDGSAPT